MSVLAIGVVVGMVVSCVAAFVAIVVIEDRAKARVRRRMEIGARHRAWMDEKGYDE